MDEDREEQVDPQRDKQAAAKHQGTKKAPEQDETDSEIFDTDQHSDAPGPTGTG